MERIKQIDRTAIVVMFVTIICINLFYFIAIRFEGIAHYKDLAEHGIFANSVFLILLAILIFAIKKKP